MAYTETKTTSYGQRLGQSAKNVIVGLLMFIGGTVLLCWNEGRTVKTTRAINEAQKVQVEMKDINTMDAGLNGKMVHATGNALTSEVLSDGLFGVSDTAIALKRTVEYYQWVEHENTEKREKVGGSEETVTTYTYTQEWVSDPVTTQFHDPEYQGRNYVLVQFDDKRQLAKHVGFGAYELPEFMKEQINAYTEAAINLSEAQKAEFERQIDTSAMNHGRQAQSDLVTVSNNVIYFGSYSTATVGDVRITFEYVPQPQEVSILAKVNGNTFEEYVAKNGYTVSRLEMGQKSAEAMFAGEHSDNKMLAWVLRLVGVLMVIFGLKMTFEILSMVLAVLPFLKNLVGVGVSLVCGVVGFVWSLLIIAIAWIAYRPILGISLLVIAAALIVFFVMRSKKRKAVEQAAGSNTSAGSMPSEQLHNQPSQQPEN